MNIKFGPHTIAEENLISCDITELNKESVVYLVHKIAKEPFICVKTHNFGSHEDNINNSGAIGEGIATGFVDEELEEIKKEEEQDEAEWHDNTEEEA